MPDPDHERFLESLSQTGPGLRLRLAMHESEVAIRQIRRLQRLAHNTPTIWKAIATWRAKYIEACDTASECIDQLFDKHGWPSGGARARDFVFRPDPSRRTKRAK